MIRVRRTTSIPMGSLSDIAFLLIIFFLVMSTIGSDKGIGALLPEAESKGRGAAPVEILIDRNSRVECDGQLTPLNRLGEQAVRLGASRPFVVQTARGAKYETYVAVLDILKDRGVQNILLVPSI